MPSVTIRLNEINPIWWNARVNKVPSSIVFVFNDAPRSNNCLENYTFTKQFRFFFSETFSFISIMCALTLNWMCWSFRIDITVFRFMYCVHNFIQIFFSHLFLTNVIFLIFSFYRFKVFVFLLKISPRDFTLDKYFVC